MEKLATFSDVVAWVGVVYFVMMYFLASVRNCQLKYDSIYSLKEAVEGRGRSYVPLWVDIVGILCGVWIYI